MVSERTTHIVLGALIAFLIAMFAVIPFFGLFLGPIFTFGGGLIGGSIAAVLENNRPRQGLFTGGLVGVIAGATSAFSGAVIGTVFNVYFTLNGGSSLVDAIGAWLFAASIGIVTGFIFVTLGAIIGGGIGSYLAIQFSEGS